MLIKASYNSTMARGWESKSVESQMDEAQAGQSSTPKVPLTEKQKAIQAERESLMLARADVLHRIESSSNERYSNQLRQALQELDTRIAKLSGAS